MPEVLIQESGQETKFGYVEVEIGQTNLTFPPQFITAFTYTDKLGVSGGDEWTLELFDTTWGILDILLAGNFNKAVNSPVKIRWGYADNMTPWHRAMITNWKPSDINLAGVNITVTGVGLGYAKLASKKMPTTQEKKTSEARPPRPASLDTLQLTQPGGSFTRLLEDVTKDVGIQLDVTPGSFHTASLESAWLSNISEDAGYRLNKEYWEKNEQDLLKWIRVVSLSVKPTRGQGPYSVSVDETTDPPTLRVLVESEMRKKYQLQTKRVYVVRNSDMGAVISFDPVFTDSIMRPTAVGVQMIYSNLKTRKTEEVTVKADTFKEGEAWDNYTVNRSDLLRKMHMPPEYNDKLLEHQLNQMFATLQTLVVEGTLKIVGDPTLRVGTPIEVIVLTPQGKKYFTSGVYTSVEAVHSIQNGGYEVEIKLKKGSFDWGATQFQGAKAT